MAVARTWEVEFHNTVAREGPHWVVVESEVDVWSVGSFEIVCMAFLQAGEVVEVEAGVGVAESTGGGRMVGIVAVVVLGLGFGGWGVEVLGIAGSGLQGFEERGSIGPAEVEEESGSERIGEARAADSVVKGVVEEEH